MDHVIGFGVRGISKSIAVASEALAARKESSPKAPLQAQNNEKNESESDEDEEVDTVEREWELDEAASAVLPNYEEATATSTEEVSTSSAGSSVDKKQLKPLPQPVILPQRRPGTRSRGFIRAYAPSLNECSNLDQEAFLAFLNNFDKASKASPIFDVINIAAFGVGMVPSSICLAVSASVSTANKFAQEIQTRYRTNKFLDDINETLFKPRGLYCMVMAYRPDLPDDSILRADVSDDVHGVALEKILGRDDSQLKQKFARLRASSGKVKSDAQIPTPAPLVYPALDRAIEAAATTSGQTTALTATSQDSSEQASNPTTNNPTPAGQLTTTQTNVTTTQTNVTSNSPFAKISAVANNPAVQDYLDRRAQSDFISKNPNSKLASALPPQKQYVNRFADPNHPVNSGSIFGLLSGGTFDPIASGRVRRAERKAHRRNEPALTAEEKHDAYMGRKVRGRKTGTPSKQIPIVGKMLGLKNHVLYLVVVNLPSETDVMNVLKEVE